MFATHPLHTAPQNAKKTTISNSVTIETGQPFVLFAGPCQLESRDKSLRLADNIATTCAKTQRSFVFKGSFDKANRTSLTGERGVGIDEGLKILESVKMAFDCPVMTDIHDATQARNVGSIVDVLQIPAFLCRQTDLLIAAGETGRAINIKKGQFLAPWDMAKVAEKIAHTGNKNIMLCERGTSFGYNTLVNDYRALPIMAQTGWPVVYDATHSVQSPGGQGGSSGGDRRFVPGLARAAIAMGVAGLFIEVHPDPDNAPSDGPNTLHLDHLAGLLEDLKRIEDACAHL